MRTSLTRIVLVLTLAVPLSACKQALGDRCQLDSDCGSDLVCAVPGAARGVGGTCQPIGGTLDLGSMAPDFFESRPDFSLAPDMTMASPDAAPDLTTLGDGAPSGD